MTKLVEDNCKGIADYILSKAADRIIFLGPLVWRPSDGTAAKVWYCMVGTGDKRGEFYADQIICHDEADRAALKLALLRPRYVVIDFDDELEMAKVADARWPCAKIKHIRKHIEAERAALLGE